MVRTGDALEVLPLLSCAELVLDLGLLDEGVEDVENRVARPDLRQRWD